MALSQFALAEPLSIPPRTQAIAGGAGDLPGATQALCMHSRLLQPRTWLLFALFASVGCASSLEANGEGPASPGRAVFIKKQWNGTRILICEGGPTDAVCYEKPN